MRKLTLLLASLLLALFLAAPSQAATPYEFDPPHCYVGFFIRHIMVPVQGVFNKVTGEVEFDPENLSASRVEVTIDVSSLDTRNAQRNTHLMSDEFFDVAKYPTIKFVGHSVEALGRGKFVVHGSLTIKNVTRQVDLPFVFLGKTTNPMNPKQEVAGFMARLNLDRLVYGVGTGKYFKMGVVGREVEVILNLELVRAK